MIVLFVFQVLAILSVLFIEHKKPEEAVLWVAVIALLPVLGLLLYLALASTVRIKIVYWVRSRRLSERYMTLLNWQLDGLKEQHDLPQSLEMDTLQSCIRFHMECCHSMLTFHNEIEIITAGKEKYELLFADIAAAETSIHISYYAIHNDEVGKALAALLEQKAKEGVRVRVLYDSLGSLFTPPSLFAGLRKAGGFARRVKPSPTHFRNHRKIVVIDGRIGYTGGMNIGRKYLGKIKNKTPWRDTHMRVRGESVRLLQYYFLYDWYFAHRVGQAGIEEPEYDLLFPPTVVRDVLPCQVVAGGVDTENANIKLSFLRLITSAKKRIWIQTPYFIPSDTVLEALFLALASGIEVNLMVPAQRSSFFLEPTTNYYIRRLLPAGLKVYQYEGYIHAKVMVVDDVIASIGSSNMDIRSLEIDDEVQMIFYDEAFNERYMDVIAEDLRHCHELDYAEFTSRGVMARGKERFFQLFSSLM